MQLFDKLFSKNGNENTTTGKKVRQLRNAKHITAKALGAACGVNETAIRNYEQGIRQVSDEKLVQLATFLGVTPSALYDRRIDNYIDVMQILFKLADDYELIPAAIPQEPRFALLTKDSVLTGSIQAWYEQRRKWERKEITLEQLKEWEDSFPLLCKDDLVYHGDNEMPESSYTDFERIIALKRSLEQMETIVNNYSKQIEDCLKAGNGRQAKMHVDIMKRTISTLVMSDIKKYG